MADDLESKAGRGCNQLLEKALIFDIYGRPMEFMLPNRRKLYKSIVGSCCTILIISVVFSYAVYKLQLFAEREDTSLQISNELEWFLEEPQEFGTESGFKLAFGIQNGLGAKGTNFNHTD